MSSLNRSVIRSIVVQSLLIVIGFVILFISAGTLDWVNGWIYAGVVSIYWVISTAVLARVNPEMLNERGSVVKEGTKGFDKLWVAIYPVLTFGNLIIMGFDAIRFQWSFMPFWLTFVGIFMFVCASPFPLWAMAVNKFFEWTARIQDDRQQYVCTSGPYRIMRHPGYAGLIFSILAYPLILGSWWGFVPSGMLAIIIVIRTALEDRTLQNELPGYKEYARQVKYRLIPLVW
ncbi:MAG: isoprenylcysteine carboxylmethyltransferase family protein [Chloroflexota bacterium]|nr:MAG: isoprenylcysteine carboxylmethyltransferase family protein [Chloroflexota bacterium]